MSLQRKLVLFVAENPQNLKVNDKASTSDRVKSPAAKSYLNCIPCLVETEDMYRPRKEKDIVYLTQKRLKRDFVIFRAKRLTSDQR